MSQILTDTYTITKGNASATACLFGATVTSWKPNGKEVLFVSKNTKFDNKKPIRGGVPVIFPQFGPWECGPQHGFARRTMWTIKEGVSGKESDTMTFILTDSEDTRKMWNHKFQFEYTLSLLNESEIKMTAVITNTGNTSFNFTFLLHTYISVPDVVNCKVNGLKGCTFIDKVKNGALGKEENEEIILTEFTDRIYQNTPSVHNLFNVSGGRNLEIQKYNFPDTVVWNPWTENAKKMDDFGDEEWKNMICVEAGHVNDSVILKPTETFKASQTLKICA